MTEQAFDLFQVAEVELIYKTTVKSIDRPKVSTSKDAYTLFLQNWDDNKIEFIEQAKVMLLNKGNRVLGICEVSTGGVSATIVDPKVIFILALKTNASAIILAHNHPSGNTQPSEADKRLTKQLIEAGRLLDINVLDHIIVTTQGYYSFTNEELYSTALSF